MIRCEDKVWGEVMCEKQNNYLLTSDFSGPVYNRFPRGEWITWVSGGTSVARAISGPRSVQGPLPPTDPRNPFAPRKSIIHRARKISGQ